MLFRKKKPVVIRQSETAECGLACLATLLNHFGHRIGLPTLRERFVVSQKGTSLAEIFMLANACKLQCRGLSVAAEAIDSVALPAILHWKGNHFVVLFDVGIDGCLVGDPAGGLKRIARAEFAACYSGTALETRPADDFAPLDEAKENGIRTYVGPLRSYLRPGVSIFLLALLLECCSLVGPLYVQTIVDAIVKTDDRTLLTVMSAGFLGVVTAQQLITFGRSWLIGRMSLHINLHSRNLVLSKLVSLPISYFERRKLGDISSRISSVDTVQRTVTVSFLEGALDGLMCLTTLVMMVRTNATLGLYAIAIAVAYAALRAYGRRNVADASEDVVVRQAAQHSHLLETIRAAKSIRLFRRESARLDSWRDLYRGQLAAELHLNTLQNWYRTLSRVLMSATNILLIWLGTTLVLDKQLSVGMLLAFISYRSQFDGRVSSLVEKYFELKMLKVHFDRLDDIMASTSEHRDVPAGPVPQCHSDGSVVVKDVRFRHGMLERPILQNVSFRIASGESVAIVGRSGCGKTTLLNLLMGVYRAEAGSIAIGGVAMEGASIHAVRTGFSTVLQDDLLLSGSILDNITFFDPRPDLEWAQRCATLASIHDDIVDMPMTYHTMVGELGSVLSGGQKQRILIARALYRRPKILFLDEATSHLDLAGEVLVNRAIGSLDVTRIIVAHRLETVLSADRILMLEDGRVFEMGKDEFVGRKADLLERQAGDRQPAVHALAGGR